MKSIFKSYLLFVSRQLFCELNLYILLTFLLLHTIVVYFRDVAVRFGSKSKVVSAFERFAIESLHLPIFMCSSEIYVYGDALFIGIRDTQAYFLRTLRPPLSFLVFKYLRSSRIDVIPCTIKVEISITSNSCESDGKKWNDLIEIWM